MRKISLLLYILLSLSQQIYAQDSEKIKIIGNIINTSGDPIEHSVSLLNRADSTIIDMYISHTGVIDMQIKHSEQLLLEISSLGYDDIYLHIEQLAPTINLGEIVMIPSSFTIDDIVVTAKIPTVLHSKGKTIINVASTSLAHQPTIFEVLDKAPGVVVSNESIKVWGRGTPVIYIDGKKLNSYSELSNLLPNEILSFQIDRNPGAIYAVDVTSVISIKTNREKNMGCSFQLYNTSVVSREYSNIAGAKLNFNHRRLHTYIDYTYNDLKNRDYTHDYDDNNIDSELLQIIDTTESLYTRDKHNLLFGIGYEFNERHRLDFQYIYTGELLNRNSNTMESIIRDYLLDELIDSNTLTINDTKTNIFSLNYKWSHSKRWESSLWSDYLFVNESLEQNIFELSEVTNNLTEVDNTAKSDALSIKLESEYKISDEIELTFGARYGMGHSLTNTITTDQIILCPSKEESDINEDNFALYLLFSHDLETIGYELGLRAETTTNMTSIDDSSVRDITEFDYFPSVNIYTNELWENLDLSLSFISKVNRPTFTQYNPTKYYLNSYSYKIGNPLLVSSKQNSLSFDATIFDNFCVWATYDKFKYPIVQTGVQATDDWEIIEYTYVNIDSSESWDIGASFNNNWNWFNLGITAGVTIPKTEVEYLSEIVYNDELSYYTQLSWGIKLAKNSYFSASYNYQSECVDLITYFTPSHNVSASFAQYFCNRKLVLICSASDILRKSYSDWESKFGSIASRQTNSMDSRSLRITLRYNFNNFKSNYTKQLNYNQELQKLQ